MKLDLGGIALAILIVGLIVFSSCSTAERSDVEPLLYCCETAVFDYESLNDDDDNIITDDDKLFKRQTCLTYEEWKNVNK